jgi:excisionase family DNA binding protein
VGSYSNDYVDWLFSRNRRYPLPWENIFAADDSTPQTPVASPDDLLNEVDAATVAGVSRKTIRKLIKDGRLDAADYGTKEKHHYRIKREALANISPPAEKTAPLPRQKTRQPNRHAATAALRDMLPRVRA